MDWPGTDLGFPENGAELDQSGVYQGQNILGDEVQPFFLDEEFDYDNVTLTPKFTAGEIATIQELSKQKRVGSGTNVCELHD